MGGPLLKEQAKYPKYGTFQGSKGEIQTRWVTVKGASKKKSWKGTTFLFRLKRIEHVRQNAGIGTSAGKGFMIDIRRVEPETLDGIASRPRALLPWDAGGKVEMRQRIGLGGGSPPSTLRWTILCLLGI